MRYKLICILIIIIAFKYIGSGQYIKQHLGDNEIDINARFVEDKSHLLSIDKIITERSKINYEAYDHDSGYATANAKWINFRFSCDDPANQNFYIVTDKERQIEAYIVVSSPDSLISDTNHSYKTLEHITNKAYSVLKFPSCQNDSYDVYIHSDYNKLRLSPLNYNLPLLIVNESEYFNKYNKPMPLTYIYLGAILFLMLLILIICIHTRQKQFILYLSYVLFNFLYVIGIDPHFGLQYFGNTEIYGNPNLIFGCTAAIMHVFFAQHLLNIRQNGPKFNLILNLSILLNLITIVAVLTGPFWQIRQITSGLAFIIQYPTLIVFAIYMLIQKHLLSGIMLISFIFSTIGAILFAMQCNGAISNNIGGMNPINILQLFSVMGTLIFGFIIGLKINEELKIRKQQELEKQEFLAKQNERLEQQVTIRTNELQESIKHLKEAQQSLIQAEKLASLGELTAGIAHEIQNPLNFVNNFSELSNELIDEMRQELKNGNMQEVEEIANSVKQNLEKINHHGKRADAIVKGMLMHSRRSTATKEPTDINALCDEFLRLSYHGLRAKDKSFNANFETHLDPTIGKIKIVPQDIGRVVLNLVNNAFYAVNDKMQLKLNGYQPLVSITTLRKDKHIEIHVSDNGNGVPQSIIDKIFQPFFTTKPTGQGTGLGLSLSYDIVTKGHSGELKMNTNVNTGTTFIIILPI